MCSLQIEVKGLSYLYAYTGPSDLENNEGENLSKKWQKQYKQVSVF